MAPGLVEGDATGPARLQSNLEMFVSRFSELNFSHRRNYTPSPQGSTQKATASILACFSLHFSQETFVWFWLDAGSLAVQSLRPGDESRGREQIPSQNVTNMFFPSVAGGKHCTLLNFSFLLRCNSLTSARLPRTIVFGCLMLP